MLDHSAAVPTTAWRAAGRGAYGNRRAKGRHAPRWPRVVSAPLWPGDWPRPAKATQRPYPKLFPDLRAELAKQARSARPATGLWARDRTEKGVDVATLATLIDQAVILPKLFRRLIDYLDLNGNDPSLDGFSAYLAQRVDPVLILPTGHYTGFDYVVKVVGQVVRLTTPPEDLVFQEL
jgi:hypothetical protein